MSSSRPPLQTASSRVSSPDSIYAASLDALSSSSWNSGGESSSDDDESQSSSASRPRRLRSLGLGLPTHPSPREAARESNHPLHFCFAQAFGERTADMPPPGIVQDSDMISAVQFNHDSDMLATGDKGGRIVILKRTHRARPPPKGWSAAIALPPRTASRRSRAGGGRAGPSSPAASSALQQHQHQYPDGYEQADARFTVPWDAPKYRFWTQFQSHEPEFDYLKSMEIEERINHIRWCRHASGARHLLATNDKTIKLWRVYEQDVKTVVTLDPEALLRPKSRRSAGFAYSSPPSPQSPQSAALGQNMRAQSGSREAASFDGGQGRVPYSRAEYELEMPTLELKGTKVVASPRRLFSNAHSYHINSISLNSDEETFLSSDDLRVNIWSLNAGGAGFNILDIKPDSMEDLTEVITSAEFHPKHCHLFMHSTSRGAVKLCDLRESALCGSWARTFQEPEETSSRSSFFSEIIASISDAKFSPCGRYVLTRDFMNLRLWDMNMERQPVLVVPVHEHLRSRLCDLYENDCIFDKFQCAFSNDGGSMLTGSYNSLFQSYSSYNGIGAAVEASVEFVSGLSGRHNYTAEGLSESLIAGSTAEELVDPSRRIMHLHASPTEPFSAVAAGPALYVYYGAP